MKKPAVASESVFNGIKISSLEGKEGLNLALSGLISNDLTNNKVHFVCVGTDRSTGDSLAPLVGTYLMGLGYKNIVGTIDEPVHAMNLQETIDNLPEDKIIIALDASLGQISYIGKFSVIKGSIRAGAGVGKNLPPVGDYGIYGCVNVGGFQEYLVLQNTRLSVVMRMARDITSAIIERFPLEEMTQLHNSFKPKYENDEMIVNRLKKQGLDAKLMKEKVKI